jgi:hypothetical protein
VATIPAKATLVATAPAAELARHVGALALPRRAINLPADPDVAPPPAFHAFIELWGNESAIRTVVKSWPFPARAWLVTEHSPLRYERSWPSGTPSPGVRLVSSLFRRVDLTRAAFADHWLGPHALVARSYTVPVWHYNQNVVIEALTPDSDEDGFVGMHFETRDQMQARWRDHPAEAARGAKDAALFMDVSRTVSLVTVETVWTD